MKRRRRPELGLEELQCYFDMPIAEAAAKLHLSINGLKKKCRKNGVTRWPYKEILATQRLRAKVEQCMKDAHISPVELRRLSALKGSLNRQERLWKQGVEPKSIAQPQQEALLVEDTDSDEKEGDEPSDRAAAQRRRVSDTEASHEASTPVAKKSPMLAAPAPAPPIDPAVFRQLSTEHSAFLPFMALSSSSPSSSSETAQANATAARTAAAATAAHSQFQEFFAAGGLRISTVTPPGAPVYYPAPMHEAPFAVPPAGFPVQLARPDFWPPSATLVYHPGAAPPPPPLTTPQARLHHIAAVHKQTLVELERARLYMYSQLPPPPPHYR